NGQLIVERCTQDFIYRIVPSDVLSNNPKLSLFVKQTGGVNPASPLEVRLVLTQLFREGKQQFRGNSDAGFDRTADSSNGIQRGFSAKAAARVGPQSAGGLELALSID